ncbi:basic proline-rich protein-like [Pezoporus flaviventris]|uniref:basic proline-rich protein-like n=1 Tax=Pezoporus flaviventris TaxID=889875 RepID=UPI002AB1223A|nr:basic proline-rich protein-like [Pezoporus flaviventris]
MPGSRCSNPGPGARIGCSDPGARIPVPDPDPGAWIRIPCSRSRFPVPGSRFPVPFGPAPGPARRRPAPGAAAAAALCPLPLPRAPPWRSGDGRRGRPGDNGAEGNREPHAGAAAMGQVLGFAHCKEAPSTASTTPDSTEGGPEEPEFPPELAVAPEPPEEEEEDEDGGTSPRTPPRELTFSYIAFGGGGSAPTEPGPRCRRDPRRSRPPA